MKRMTKRALVILFLAAIGVVTLSCSQGDETEQVVETEIIDVQRGDLAIDITAVGNLAFSVTEKLSFEIAGTIEEVLVEAGDAVEEGQVIASLDTSERDEKLEALDEQITTAEKQVTAKQRDLVQAEINLTNAEIALEETSTTYSADDYKIAQADIDEARRNLGETVNKLYRYETGSVSYNAYQDIVLQAQVRLDTAENKLNSMISGFETGDVTVKTLQLKNSQGRYEDALLALDTAETTVSDAKIELLDAERENPLIVAPFDGFITGVSVKVGDAIKKGSTAVVLADPTRFEAEVFVNETDIFQIQVGGAASMQVDAAQTVTLPARVTRISPTATIQSGIVNYKVTVEMTTSQPMLQSKRPAERPDIPDLSSGEIPERLQQLIDSGRITKEQAEAMIERIQSGEMPFPGGAMPGGGFPQSGETPSGMPGGLQSGRAGQQARMVPGNFQLRQGLSVTVSILVDERTDVLLVPNTAVLSQGGQNYVQVVASDGTFGSREIETGISDWQFTEILNGLIEGEQVVITRTSSTTDSHQSGGAIRFPGMGGTRR